jgi:hypothetical protein
MPVPGCYRFVCGVVAHESLSGGGVRGMARA